MRHEQFEAREPVELYVEIQGGSVHLDATGSTDVSVEIEGTHADEVLVEQRGRSLRVVAPRPRGLGGGREWAVDLRIRVPGDSDVIVQSGSAPVTQQGELRSMQCKAGSGHVVLDRVGRETLVDTGSGRITVAHLQGDARLRTGSGGVRAGRLDGEAIIATGSGDVSISDLLGELSFKAGSGSLSIERARGKVRGRTGSGDVSVGRLQHGEIDAKTGSGSVSVHVPEGTPVWTDVVSGRPVESTLPSAGEPAPGQDFVKLSARTGSGTVRLAPSESSDHHEHV